MNKRLITNGAEVMAPIHANPTGAMESASGTTSRKGFSASQSALLWFCETRPQT
jgi:hypothetical protein